MSNWRAAAVLVVVLAAAVVAAASTLDRDGVGEPVQPIDLAPLDRPDRKPRSDRAGGSRRNAEQTPAPREPGGFKPVPTVEREELQPPPSGRRAPAAPQPEPDPAPEPAPAPAPAPAPGPSPGPPPPPPPPVGDDDADDGEDDEDESDDDDGDD